MRFKGLDLNLLVALDALMTERNLTAAARSINLSQPAMSVAVARLRAYFCDELFTMRGRELVPTPRAEGLAAPIREALVHIQLSVISRDVFDPAKSDRRFRIILSDFMAVVFFRTIVERIAREAPAVGFELLPLPMTPMSLQSTAGSGCIDRLSPIGFHGSLKKRPRHEVEKTPLQSGVRARGVDYLQGFKLWRFRGLLRARMKIWLVQVAQRAHPAKCAASVSFD